MAEITVDKISPNEVSMSYGLVTLVFSFVAGQLKVISRSNAGGGFYSPGKCSVPKEIFAKMTRQAAKILADRRKKEVAT